MKFTLGLLLLAVAVTAMDGGKKPTPRPTRKPDFLDVAEIQSASFHEFDRTKKARCDGKAGPKTSCWADSEGMFYRYGCRKADTRIFTDFCMDSKCNDCESQWKWAGEKQGVCYDDGKQLYAFKCDDETNPADFNVDLKPTEAPDTTKTCGDLGWPLQPGDLSICAYSKVNNGMCSGTVSWADAADMCASQGARLCTSNELLTDEAKGTGCKADCEPIWTSDPCTKDGNKGYNTAAGSKKCENVHPTTCEDPVSSKRMVRCCADAFPSSGSAADKTQGLELPEGYTIAVAHDYRASDGNCGLKAALAQYTCWNNPVDKKSYRFACQKGSNKVFSQNCGTDADCKPKNCKGEWASRGDLVDKCYSTGDGVLYRYTCPKE